jgi:hypothetical protein
MCIIDRLSMATRQLTARRRSRRLSIATCSLSTASGRGLSIGRANAITIGCGSSRRRALGSSRRRGALIIGPILPQDSIEGVELRVLTVKLFNKEKPSAS